MEVETPRCNHEECLRRARLELARRSVDENDKRLLDKAFSLKTTYCTRGIVE